MVCNVLLDYTIMFDVFGFVFVCFCVVASLQEWIEARLREIQTGGESEGWDNAREAARRGK